MIKLAFVAVVACLGAHCLVGAAPSVLERSTPEAQGILSTAILAFIDAVDTPADVMNSFMLVRHGQVVAEGWWTPYNAATPHTLYSLGIAAGIRPPVQDSLPY